MEPNIGWMAELILCHIYSNKRHFPNLKKNISPLQKMKYFLCLPYCIFPKFEANFWPDERLEQVKHQSCMSCLDCILSPSLRPTEEKETHNPLAAILNPPLTSRYYCQYPSRLVFMKCLGNSWQQLHLRNMERKLGQRIKLCLQVKSGSITVPG